MKRRHLLADEHLDRPRTPVRVVRHVPDEERGGPLVHRDVRPRAEEGLEPRLAHLDRGRSGPEALLVEVGVQRVHGALQRPVAAARAVRALERAQVGLRDGLDVGLQRLAVDLAEIIAPLQVRETLALERRAPSDPGHVRLLC
jgi:hypothetical protein